MKNIMLILSLLSLSLFAEKITLTTIKNEFIIFHNNKGNIDFVNKKYHQKNVILYLFGRDCPFCKKEVPRIKALMKNKKVQIIGIHAYKDIGDKALKAYAKKVGYTFDILSFKNDIKMLNFLKSIGVWMGSVPFSMLIDEDGNVHEVNLSMIDEELD